MNACNTLPSPKPKFMKRLYRNSVKPFGIRLITWLLVFQMVDLTGSRVSALDLFLGGVANLTLALGDGPASVQTVTKDQPFSATLQLSPPNSLAPLNQASDFYWFGPFPATVGLSPTVSVPAGLSTVSLLSAGLGTGPSLTTSTFSIVPAFLLAARPKPGEVQLTWPAVTGANHYVIYRAIEADNLEFQEIGQTISTYATFLDATVENEHTYLYFVAALGDTLSAYSGVASAHPTASRGVHNYAPVIYSNPVESGTAGIPYSYNVLATDPNNDTLHYSLGTAPGGMTIDEFSGLVQWMPNAGSYDVSVSVSDAKGGTATQTFKLNISTVNTPPVANAGPDQTAFVTQTVTLDGSKSSDVDGDPLTFFWSFVSRPAGSSATLSDPTAVKPAFIVDAEGTYVVQLVVNDGFEDSAPDTVSISTVNTKPVADAGPDQTALIAQTVTLDGSKSSDVDGNPLTFFWSFVSRPGGSTATLSDPTAVKPTFVVDAEGPMSCNWLSMTDSRIALRTPCRFPVSTPSRWRMQDPTRLP